MTVMDWLRQRFPSVWPTPPPPRIDTPYGPTTESARLQAVRNMLADENIRARVESLLINKMGSVEKGMAEMRRRYPEVYKDS